jgi:hypothetical protein
MIQNSGAAIAPHDRVHKQPPILLDLVVSVFEGNDPTEKKNTVLRQVETIIKKNRSCSTQLFCWGSFWGLSLATAICWLDLAIQTWYVVHNTNSASFNIPTPCFSRFFKKLKNQPQVDNC